MVEDWLARLEAALGAGDTTGAAALFAPQGYWRDLLALTWNIHTCEGREAIAAMLGACLPHARPRGFRAAGPVEETPDGPAAWIAFETGTLWCTGRVVLRDGLAQVLFTAAEDLKGFEEARGRTRPLGTLHAAARGRRNWRETRDAEAAAIGRERQPHTLVVGAGQGGLALGARLKSLGVPALIVEANARAGDSWRNRYRSLVLHDPVWYDHMPYLPFPETWPVFCPKDKMGDWLEAYAQIFELDLWTGTRCLRARRDDGRWHVTLDREGEEVTVTPREIVFATGAYGPPYLPHFPAAEDYEGRLIHSSDYRDGAPFAGRRAVVIGGGSSAHDVAVDLWEAGAEVTMLMRSPTIVVRSQTLMELGFDLYSEDALDRGIDVDSADRIAAATPYALMPERQRALYQRIRERDADFYAALERVGYPFDFGEDESGLMMRALRTASGYYIDVGCCQLAIDGRIAVVAREGIARLERDGLRLASGRHLAADVIVACTGYRTMSEALVPILGRAAADAVGPCWGLGSGIPGDPGPWQGELRNMWKPTAIEGLWFHGGNLALSRYYSRFVALQLKARAEGVATPVYGAPSAIAARELAAQTGR